MKGSTVLINIVFIVQLIFSHVPHLQWPDGYQLEHKEETKVFDPNTQVRKFCGFLFFFA